MSGNLADILNNDLAVEGNLLIKGKSLPVYITLRLEPRSIDNKITGYNEILTGHRDKKPGYRNMICVMREKYSRMGDACKIIDVLSGNYYNGRRVWYWRDRMEAFEGQMESCELPDLVIDELIKLVKSNRYLRKAHPEILDKLCSHLRKRQSCEYSKDGMLFGGEDMEIVKYNKEKGKFEKGVRLPKNRGKMLEKIKGILKN